MKFFPRYYKYIYGTIFLFESSFIVYAIFVPYGKLNFQPKILFNVPVCNILAFILHYLF